MKQQKNSFHFINEFVKHHDLKDFSKVIASWRTSSNNETDCGILQLYFYRNLLNPIEINKRVNDNDLSKEGVETVLNGLFALVEDQKKNILQEYISLNNISFNWKL